MRRLLAAVLVAAILGIAPPPAAAQTECTAETAAGARASVCQEDVDGADTERRARWTYLYVPLPAVYGVAPEGKLELRATEWSTVVCRDREDGRFCYERNEVHIASSSRTGAAPVDGFAFQLVTYKDRLDGQEGYCVVSLRSTVAAYETNECRATPAALP